MAGSSPSRDTQVAYPAGGAGTQMSPGLEQEPVASPEQEYATWFQLTIAGILGCIGTHFIGTGTIGATVKRSRARRRD